MTSDRSVTVVIPYYRSHEFVGSAVDSVLHDPMVAEILVVDDGSPGISAGEALSPIPPGVTVIWQRNGGVAAARNTGLAHARSPFVVFLDADDEMKRDGLTSLFRAFAANPQASAACGRSEKYVCATGEVKEVSPDLPQPAYPAILLSSPVWHPSQILYRTARLRHFGGWQACGNSDDLLLYFRFFAQAPIVTCPAIVSRWRIHDANTSHQVVRMLASVATAYRRHRSDLSPAIDVRMAFTRGRKIALNSYCDWAWEASARAWRVRGNRRIIPQALMAILRHNPIWFLERRIARTNEKPK